MRGDLGVRAGFDGCGVAVEVSQALGVTVGIKGQYGAEAFVQFVGACVFDQLGGDAGQRYEAAPLIAPPTVSVPYSVGGRTKSK